MKGELQLPRLRRPRPVPRGLEAWLERWAGRWVRWRARREDHQREAELIREDIKSFEGLRNDRVDAVLQTARAAWSHQRTRTSAARRQALAVVGAVASRELGLIPHREQIMGVIGLEQGWLVEMATGEGKTLTLAMAAVLAAWRGRACHVLTANDYLAARDARSLRRFYERCGVRVAAVVGESAPAERNRLYQAGVVYTTSRELVGDFLRDRLNLGKRVSAETWRPWLRRHGIKGPPVVLPRLHTVLVDEADQVLVDDAVTPLIISMRQDNASLTDLCRAALAEAEGLEAGRDFEVDIAKREARVDRRVAVDRADEGSHPLLRVPRWREEWIGKALVALHAYESGKHYVVQQAKVVLVDESTGRTMADRSLGEGMHALLEAKEGLTISAPTETMASLSFQRFFRQMPRLAGVTGTAKDAAVEFWQLYRLPVVVIPTHRPVQRVVLPEHGFVDEPSKWRYVAALAGRYREAGQPCLIGTRTVAASESLAAVLREHGLPFTLLNAVRNEDEAGIIAAAGVRGQITIATNMAGRGTDIVPAEDVLSLGGLRVIATERHSSSRIDRQLFGRCARQGQPGVVEPLASWSDEVVKHHLPRWWQHSGRRFGGTGWFLRLSLRFAQWKAGRVDASRRLGVLKHDQWLDEHLSMGLAAAPPAKGNARSINSRSLRRP